MATSGQLRPAERQPWPPPAPGRVLAPGGVCGLGLYEPRAGQGPPRMHPPTPDQPWIKWNGNKFNFPMKNSNAFLASPNPPFPGLSPLGKKLQPRWPNSLQGGAEGTPGETHRRGTCPAPGISAGGSAGSGCGWCGRSGSSSAGSRSSWHCSAGSAEKIPAQDGEVLGKRLAGRQPRQPPTRWHPSLGVPRLTLQPSQVITP